MDKLMDIEAELKLKLHRCKKMDLKLNEQAVHFEVMLSKINKETLKEKIVNQSQDNSSAEAAAHIFSDKNVFNKILSQKGFIKEGQRSIFDRMRTGEPSNLYQENI